MPLVVGITRASATSALLWKMLLLGVLILLFVANSDGITIDEAIVDATADDGSRSTVDDNPSDDFRVEGQEGTFVKVQLDMILPKATWESMDVVNDLQFSSTRQKRQAMKNERQLWPGIIPYIIAKSFTAEDRVVVLEAIRHWERYTCLRFQPAVKTDVSVITFGNHPEHLECSSQVGMKGGTQFIYLSNGCRQKGIIIHIIGHAIGLYHEHQRVVRDEYLTIHWDNIREDKTDQFDKLKPWMTQNFSIPYDYDSVMHYGKLFFSRDKSAGLVTLEPMNVAYLDTIGMAETASFLDIRTVNAMYHCSARCVQKDCPEGGFLRGDCFCWCRGQDGQSAVRCGQCTRPEIDTEIYDVFTPDYVPAFLERYTPGFVLFVGLHYPGCGYMYMDEEWVCVDGEWTGRLPECHLDCIQNSTYEYHIDNETLSTGETLPDNLTVSVTCRVFTTNDYDDNPTGDDDEVTETEITCRNGSWVGTFPQKCTVLLIPTVTLAYQCHKRTCYQGTTCDSITTCETTVGCITTKKNGIEVYSCAATVDRCINSVINDYGELVTKECCTSDLCNDGTVQNCIQNSKYEYHIDNETLSAGETLPDNSTVSVTCRVFTTYDYEDYLYRDDDEEITCRNGSWVGTFPQNCTVLLIPTVTLAYQCHERTCYQGTTCDSTRTCETTIGCRTTKTADRFVYSCAARVAECINVVTDFYGVQTRECCTSDLCNDGTVQSLPQPQTENYCYNAECTSSDSTCLDSLITHVQDNQIYAYCKATHLGCQTTIETYSDSTSYKTSCSPTRCITVKSERYTVLCCADNLCNNGTTRATMTPGTHATGATMTPGTHAAGATMTTGTHATGATMTPGTHATGATITTGTHATGATMTHGTHATGATMTTGTHATGATMTTGTHATGAIMTTGTHATSATMTTGTHATGATGSGRTGGNGADKQVIGPALGGVGALCVIIVAVTIIVIYRKCYRINTPAPLDGIVMSPGGYIDMVPASQPQTLPTVMESDTNAAIPMGDNSSRIVPMGDNSRQIVPTGSVSDEMEKSPSAGALSVPSENEETSGYRRVGKIFYDPNDELGRGLKSVVYRGRFEKRDVAVKRSSSNKAAGETMDDIRKVYREIDIMNKLDQTGHEHIVRYYVSEVIGAYIYLVFELCDGTLKDYVKTPAWQQKLSPTAVTLHMARGLHYLFSLGVAHRDIKPENVLIIVNAPRAVIADFGHSKLTLDDVCSISNGSTSMFGTVGYIAPEAYSAILMASGEEPVTSMMSSQSDIFSLGCLFYFTLSLGEHPFGVNNLSSQTNIHDHASPTFDKLREWQYTMKQLIACMIEMKPEDRPSTTEVLKHPALWASDKVIRYFSEANACLDEKILQAGYVPDPPNNNWLQNLPNYTLHYLRGYHNGNAYGGRGRNAASHPKAAYHLRAIRNLETHFKDVTFPIDVRNEMGDSNDDHVKFWLTANPTFLMHVYSKISTCPKLSSYDQI